MIYSSVKIKPSEQIAAHTQEAWELAYIIKGKGTRTIAENSSPFDDGDLVLIIPDIKHGWNFDYDHTDDEGYILHDVLTFRRSFLERLASLSEEFLSVRDYFFNLSNALEFMGDTKENIVHLMSQMKDKSKAEQTALGIQILTAISSAEQGLRNAGEYKKTLTAKEKIELVKNYVSCNTKNGITLSDGAKHLNMSDSGFCEFFKKQTGESFMTYVIKNRLSWACYLLSRPSMRISEVCYESGFQDVPYFNRTFKRYMGMSPSQYRKVLQNKK